MIVLTDLERPSTVIGDTVPARETGHMEVAEEGD